MTVTKMGTRTPTILTTVGTLRSLTSKNNDSYENGTSVASTTRTVPRIVTWTATLLATVHTFEAVRESYYGRGGYGGGGAVDTRHDIIYCSGARNAS